MLLRYTALVLTAVLIVGCASTKKLDPDAQYQQVRQVGDLPADVVYDRSLQWMAEQFVSANDAIQVRDDESNRLVTNASMPVPGTGATANMSIIVEARDGRFRFTSRNLTMEIIGMEDRMTQGMYEDLKPELERQVSDLENFIRGEVKDTDW